MRLTEVKIRTAKPGPKAVKMFDGGGLYLNVTSEGGKNWRWAYRFDGKPKTMSFGPYPELTLADAREAHHEARKVLRSGVDPMAQRKAEKTAGEDGQGETFKAIALRWHETWGADKNPEYAKDVMIRLTRDIFPSLGGLTLDNIDTPKIVATIKKIEERGANEIATRSLGNVGQVFRYAIAHGLATRNPVPTSSPSTF